MKNVKLALTGLGLSAVMLLTACSESVEKVDFVHGTVDGNKYTTELFGLTAEFDDGYTFYTDTELATINGVSDMSAESIQSAIDTNQIVYDMYVGTETGSNITLIAEDLTKSNNASLDEQGYVDASFPALKSQLEAQGLTVNDIQKTSVTFAGASTPCVQIDLSMGGVNMYEYQVYKKAGQYMCVITITAFSKEEAESMASCFSAV